MDLKLFEELANRIRRGECSIRKWWYEFNNKKFRSKVENSYALVGPAIRLPTDKKITLFTIVRREDKEIWHNAKLDERNRLPRLAWLRAPEHVYKTPLAIKCELQNSFTTYENAQSIINV